MPCILINCPLDKGKEYLIFETLWIHFYYIYISYKYIYTEII